MAIDTKELFNKTLPEAMSSNADAAKEVGATFQLNITGSGEWFVDCSDSGPSCEAGSKEADCTITISEEDFQELVSNPSAGMQLFMGGKLKVEGNPMLAMKLQKLFALAG